MCAICKAKAKKLQMLTDRLQLFYERSKSWKQLWFLYPKIKSEDMSSIPIADYTKIVFGAKDTRMQEESCMKFCATAIIFSRKCQHPIM